MKINEHTHRYTYIYIYIYICICIYMYIYMYTYIYICKYTYMHVCTQVHKGMHISIFKHAHTIHRRVCVSMYVCMHVCMYVRTVYVCMYQCVTVCGHSSSGFPRPVPASAWRMPRSRAPKRRRGEPRSGRRQSLKGSGVWTPIGPTISPESFYWALQRLTPTGWTMDVGSFMLVDSLFGSWLENVPSLNGSEVWAPVL